MDVYAAENIRNIVLLGHGGVGKTTIAEQMAFITKATTRLGKVTDKNTVSDFDQEEMKRGFSINTSLIPIEYSIGSDKYKINVLDTPGYFDFAGEVAEAMSVASAALIVVDAKAGMQVGTELAWEKAENAHMPRMIFVNGMDDPEADLDRVLDQLKEKFGNAIAPFQVPIKEGGKFVGFVNVPTMEGRRFAGNKVESCAIPAGMEDEIEPIRSAILEAVAATDDELMEKFFMEEEFTPEEIDTAIHNGILGGEIVPVLCGAAINGTGIGVLMNSICSYIPGPAVAAPKAAAKDASGNDIEVACDPAGAFSGFVFKTSVDPFLGKISYFKVMSGAIHPNDTIVNVGKEAEARVSRIYTMRGKEQIELAELSAGDIGVLTKLTVTQTCDTIAAKDFSVIYPAVPFAPSLMSMAISPKNKGDEDKMTTSLNKLIEEDPTLRSEVDGELKQQLIYGAGDQHLDVAVNKLKNKFKVEVELSKPKVSYRETILGRSEVRGKYKKQSGGHGQYGDVLMVFEPSGDMEKPYVFEEQIFGGSVPKNYFPAVEKGIQESVKEGLLAGYPMVGVKATLIDGSYHPVDSSEMAFKTATSMAFKDGIPKAKPVILEPIATVSVLVNEEYMGDIMGDLTKRRGRVLGMEHLGGKVQLNAEVPMSEMSAYATDLRSMTQGRGSYTMEFARYEQTLPDVQAKIIAENKKDE
ncbi:MAG: elongation factor G [Firmicutes bacterium]|nr:elongation factor G [Bacillota bacterium]